MEQTSLRFRIEFGGEPPYVPRTNLLKWPEVNTAAAALVLPEGANASTWMHIHDLPDKKETDSLKTSLRRSENFLQKDKQNKLWEFHWVVVPEVDHTITLWVCKLRCPNGASS